MGTGDGKEQGALARALGKGTGSAVKRDIDAHRLRRAGSTALTDLRSTISAPTDGCGLTTKEMNNA
jgi:hypothetical protein